MRIGYAGSSDSTSTTTNAVHESANTRQTSNTQTLQQKLNDLARLVSEHAYPRTNPSTPTPSATPGPTVGSDPKVQGAVNNIFNAAAHGSNPTQREQAFANALAGQPADVVAAVRNDPRYQPLLNQFINGTLARSAKLPPPPGSSPGDHKPQPGNPESWAEWVGRAQTSLGKLTDWLSGQPSKFNGLPPSIAADVVNSPQAQSLFANLNAHTWTVNDVSSAFQNESRIADALGSGTPAAKTFTREIAKQIVGNQGQGHYPQYLGVENTVGAQHASPALAIAVAERLQAGGDRQDAQDVMRSVERHRASTGQGQAGCG